MCPACMASVAVIVAGLTSTGGLTALVVETLRARGNLEIFDPPIQIEGNQHDSEDRIPNGVARRMQATLEQGEGIHPAAR